MRLLFPLLLAAAAQCASASPSDVTLHTLFTGQKNCLDIVNAGDRDQLHMTQCGRYSGQMWEVVPDPGNSFVRLKTRFTGADMCLDVVNDGTNNQVRMATCANVTGQQWHMDQTNRGLGMRLWNQFTGQGKCLDIINDGSGRLQLASCGDYSGQYWNTRASGVIKRSTKAKRS